MKVHLKMMNKKLTYAPVVSRDTLVNTRLHNEANALGLTIVGYAVNGNPSCRHYKHKCGHTIDIKTCHVRNGSGGTCTVCLNKSRQAALDTVGYDLLKQVDSKYFTIRHRQCGTNQDYALGTLTSRGWTPTCNHCLIQSRQAALDTVDYDLVKQVNGKYFTIKHRICGTDQDYALGNLTTSGATPTCNHCLNKSREEALDAVGYALVKQVDKSYFTIKHRICGTEQDYALGSLTSNGATPTCLSCGDNHYTQNTSLYLKVYQKGRKKIVKFGLANNVNAREKTIKPLPGVLLVEEYVFKAGRKLDEVKFEKSLHTVFKSQKLDIGIAKQFITSGFTECYPINMFNELYGALEDKLGSPIVSMQAQQLLLAA
jgi:alpha-D-ribose 1-methylphosphonate 5-triphosphate synthase subunit PhnG